MDKKNSDISATYNNLFVSTPQYMGTEHDIKQEKKQKRSSFLVKNLNFYLSLFLIA